MALVSVALYAVGETTGDVSVSFFPEAAYAGYPSTFELRGPPGARVRAFFKDHLLFDGLFDAEMLEINLTLEGSGILRFVCENWQMDYKVQAPVKGVQLWEEDGYLQSFDGPVILLAERRFAQRNERRWESVRVISHLIGRDTRPLVRSGLFFAADRLRQDLHANLAMSNPMDSNAWQCVQLPSCSWEIHAFIAKLANLEKQDAAVVLCSPIDMERGVDLWIYINKLAWFLQSLEASGFKQTVLISPMLDKMRKQRFPDIQHQLRMCAKAHHTHFVHIPRNAPEQDASWVDSLIKGLHNILRIERQQLGWW